jgi:hypothetical protein
MLDRIQLVILRLAAPVCLWSERARRSPQLDAGDSRHPNPVLKIRNVLVNIVFPR